MRARTRTAVGVATVWAAIAVLWIGRVFPVGWPVAPVSWPVASSPSLPILGLPLLFFLARAALWGLLPALFLSRVPLPVVSVVVVAIDTALFATADVGLFVGWEVLGVAFALVPSQVFFRLTRDQRHLRARVWLHFVGHAALIAWALPAVALDWSGGSFAALANMSFVDKMWLQVVALPGILGVAATMEFFENGRGTPMPHDAPIHLVTTGPFAYVANPFQLMKVSFLVAWGLFLGSAWLIACAGAVFLYGVTIARWNEERAMTAQFGDAWLDYRAHVRRWRPRLTPWHEPSRPRARLYFDGDCGQCRQLARWFASATHLELVPGGTGVRRLTYERDHDEGDEREEGIGALARALEHLNVGWAFLGWSMRLPALRPLFQVIANVVTRARDPVSRGPMGARPG